MKKLVAITALGIALGFSNSSFAVNFVDVDTKSPSSQEVTTEITGGEVETNSMSFYLSPVKKGTGREQTAKAADNDEPTLLVFGVSL